MKKVVMVASILLLVVYKMSIWNYYKTAINF